MRIVRCSFMALLLCGILSCGFLDSQLVRDPATGKSKLEQEVEIAKPFVPAPWGEVSGLAGILLTSIYGAFRAHRADVQTDKNGNGIPDDQETPKA